MAGNDNEPPTDMWDAVLASSGRSSGPRAGGHNDGRTFGSLALEDEPQAQEARLLCPIRFQSQWEDEETGLHYNRFRYYNPVAAQYVSPDPIGLDGGERTHAYVYQPGAGVDPLGQVKKGAECCFGARSYEDARNKALKDIEENGG